MSRVIVTARCENGHEQHFAINGDMGAGLGPEGLKAYWANFIEMTEYASNESPVGPQGCLECGGKVKMTVEDAPEGNT